jgi:hypothetical protein
MKNKRAFSATCLQIIDNGHAFISLFVLACDKQVLITLIVKTHFFL